MLMLTQFSPGCFTGCPSGAMIRYLTNISVLFLLGYEKVIGDPVSVPNPLPQYNTVPNFSCFVSPSWNPEEIYLDDYPKPIQAIQDAMQVLLTLDAAFPSSLAYKHYFGEAHDWDVKQMYGTMITTLQPSLTGNAVRFGCGDDQNRACERTQRKTAVDRDPGGDITFCDSFYIQRPYPVWLNLADKEFDDQSDGWCRPDEDPGVFFKVNAYAVIYALSQLDIVGRRAKLFRYPYVSPESSWTFRNAKSDLWP